MDKFLWVAGAAVFIAGAASLARYRIVALVAALIAGGAILVDYYDSAQSPPVGAEVAADQSGDAMQAHGSPVAWSGLYINGASDPRSGKLASVSALSIAGTNVGSEDVRLEEVYFRSGADGAKLNVRIGRGGARLNVGDTGPLPPGAFFFVVSDPVSAGSSGLSPDDFLKTWPTISFVAKYNGTTQNIEFDRKTLESILSKPSQP